MVTTTYTFLQMKCQPAPLKESLHDPWCHFISGFWRVSLAEYLLILRVYSHLLQVVMYHGDCKNWITPTVAAECDHGHDPSELSCPPMLLMEVDPGTDMYLK
jgi:hypothetical protein